METKILSLHYITKENDTNIYIQKNTNTNKRRVVNQLLANANYGNKDSFIFGKEGQRERVKIQLQNYKHICKYTMVQIREENFWQLRTGWTKTDVQTAWG